MNVRKVLVLISMLLCTLCHAEVHLRFCSSIDSGANTLGDVLIMEHDEKHWLNLPLHSHPTPGQLITKTQIIDWLTQQVGPFTWKWEGKTQIKVRNPIRSTGSALLNKAKQDLIKDLGTQYSKIDIKALSQPKDSEFPVDSFNTIIKNSFPTAKRVCVWLIHGKKRIAIWFDVHAYSKVLVAKYDLKANTPLSDNAFTRQERDISGLKSPPISYLNSVNAIPRDLNTKSDAALNGSKTWLKTSLEKDHILLKSQLKEPPLVNQGQLVRLSVHQNSITVLMDGVALADGVLGERIKVKNPTNKKTFFAEVTGVQQAEIKS